jgi:hypothetical protein
MRGGVDNCDQGAGALGRIQGSGKAGRRAGDDGLLGRAAVAPPSGGGLHVEVDDGDRSSRRLEKSC